MIKRNVKWTKDQEEGFLITSCLLGHSGHGLSQMANISWGDSGDGNSAVLGEINAVVLRNLLNLLRGHPSEGEHSNLVGDMFPVARGSFKWLLIFPNFTHIIIQNQDGNENNVIFHCNHYCGYPGVTTSITHQYWNCVKQILNLHAI